MVPIYTLTLGQKLFFKINFYLIFNLIESPIYNSGNKQGHTYNIKKINLNTI